MARPQGSQKENYKVRAEQTVSEMVVESLARRAEALSEETGRSFEYAFAEVLKTPAGRRLGELADGLHRHEKAARWQAELLVDREAGRPPHLRESENEGVLDHRLGYFAGWTRDAVGREENYAQPFPLRC